MKQFAENTSQLSLQIADIETIKKALRQERELAALAREETESFRHQLQKLKAFLREAQKESKDARDQVGILQQQLAEAERQAQGQKLHTSTQLDQTQRQATIIEAENATYKLRLEKLAVILRERDKKIAELQQYELSFRKVSEQKAQHDTAAEKHLSQIHALEQELANAAQQLDAGLQRATQLEDTIRALQTERQAGHSELEALQAQLEALKGTAATSKLALEEATSKQNHLEAFLQLVQAESLDALRVKMDALQAQLQTAETAAAGKLALQAENEALQAALAKAKSAQEEAEARLKTAHQHLAKKVKEAAELSDKAQFQQTQLHEQQNQLNQARLRSAELQQTLDAHVQQEKRLQEQIQQSTKAMDTLSARWEEKYFKIYEKWQEGEVRIKEMKKLEEKYNQMQVLLTNIGGVFGVPMGTHTPASQPPQPARSSEIWTSHDANRSKDAPESFSSLVTASLPSVPHEIAARSDAPLENIVLSAPTAVEGLESSFAFHSAPQADSPPFALHAGSDGHQPAAVSEDDRGAKGPYQNLFDMPKPAKRLKNTLFD